MTDFLNIALYIAMGGVVLALGFGIYAMFRGGDYGRSNSNKMMRLRVLMQFIAVLILIGIMLTKGLLGDRGEIVVDPADMPSPSSSPSSSSSPSGQEN